MGGSTAATGGTSIGGADAGGIAGTGAVGAGGTSAGGTGGAGAGSGGAVGSGGWIDGTGGTADPASPCDELCAGVSALASGALTFDGLLRGYLHFGAGAACYVVTPEDLGYAIMAWNCQGFANDRTLAVNGISYPGCSGASAPYSLPREPQQRAGGYCFQVNAGSDTSAVVPMF